MKLQTTLKLFLCFSLFMAAPAFALERGAQLYKISGSNGALQDFYNYDGGTPDSDVITRSIAYYNTGSTEYIYALAWPQSGGSYAQTNVLQYEWDGLDLTLANSVTLPLSTDQGLDIAMSENGSVIILAADKANTVTGTLFVYSADLSTILNQIDFSSYIPTNRFRENARFSFANNNIYTVGTDANTNYRHLIRTLLGIDTSAPYVETIGAIPFTSLTSFSTSDNGDGNFGFQLSADGTNYYYYNGASWVLETGDGYPTETTNVTDVNANLATLPVTGDLRVRAFLSSDGVQLPALSSITVSYGGAAPPPTPTPSGGSDRDIAIYRQRWLPKTPIPIEARALSDSEIEYIFDTRLADDVNADNDASGFYLYDNTGKRVSDSGINAISKSKNFSIIEHGLKPNTYISGRRVSGFNGAGESSWSLEFPPIYTLPKTPGIKSVDATTRTSVEQETHQ